jgi:hypothetical protein
MIQAMWVDHPMLSHSPSEREPTCIPVLLLEMMRFWVATGARFSDCFEVPFQICVLSFALVEFIDRSDVPLVELSFRSAALPHTDLLERVLMIFCLC